MELNYYVDYTSHPIDLNLWEAEFYFSAIPVQQLIGNLVYHSNQGNYEPRLCEKWERHKPNAWRFYLRNNLICENGELITAQSFKKSLERSLLITSRKGGSPVLKNLLGYDEFVAANSNKSVFEISELPGIIAENNYLEFTFARSTRSGVCEILSFAPYGYICADNLNDDGSWKNKRSFISSGAYKIKSVNLGKLITLQKRDEFQPNRFAQSPDVVRFHQVDKKELKNLKVQGPTIVDSMDYSSEGSSLRKFELEKDYLSAIFLGNLSDGILSDANARKVFRQAIEAEKKLYAAENEVQFSYSIYASTSLEKKDPSETEKITLDTSETLLIRGHEPTGVNLTWAVLKKTLERLGLKYQFSGTSYKRDDITNQAYDIRMGNPSIGGKLQPWVIDVLFRSKLNSSLPDPSGCIMRALEDYESDGISEEVFVERVTHSIERDNAVIPIRHYGLELFLSPEIIRSSLSPSLSIVRFDQLGISLDDGPAS